MADKGYSESETGAPTSGGEFGAKTSENKKGVVAKMDAVTPKAPEQPVRH